MEYLQSSTEFGDAVSTFHVTGLRNRVGLSSIVLTLTRMLFERITEAYEKKQAELIEEANQKEAAATNYNVAKGLVNRFVGFGVGKAIRGIVSRMGEDDSKYESLEKQYNFTTSMRIFHSEAILSASYLKQSLYYETALSLQNKGFLALVSPKYFEFGEKLMQEVILAFPQSAFAQYGTDVYSHCSKVVKQAMLNNGHRKRFMACSKSDHCVGNATKLSFFGIVVNATMNSYYKAMLTVYQEENTKRKGKHHTANAFRPNLASIAQHSLITDTHQLEEAKKAKKKTTINS
jgi:hypothetical protein